MSSTPSPAEYCCFVGVDIAAASFTAIWTTGGRMQPKTVAFSQSATGFAAFQQHLQATHVAPQQTLIVLEATGSYWIALAVTLHEAGYAVAVLNPAQLHNYAQSLPRRGKTDAPYAQVFVRFAAERVLLRLCGQSERRAARFATPSGIGVAVWAKWPGSAATTRS